MRPLLASIGQPHIMMDDYECGAVGGMLGKEN
jgi:hypothetical protein